MALVGIFETRVVDECSPSLPLADDDQPGLAASTPKEPSLNDFGRVDKLEGLGLGDGERFEGDLLPYSDCGGRGWDGMSHGGCLPARVRLCGATAAGPFANPGIVFSEPGALTLCAPLPGSPGR